VEILVRSATHPFFSLFPLPLLLYFSFSGGTRLPSQHGPPTSSSPAFRLHGFLIKRSATPPFFPLLFGSNGFDADYGPLGFAFFVDSSHHFGKLFLFGDLRSTCPSFLTSVGSEPNPPNFFFFFFFFFPPPPVPAFSSNPFFFHLSIKCRPLPPQYSTDRTSFTY